MAQEYHRLFLRWGVLRGYVPAILFAAVCLTLELLFFYNAVGSGFEDKSIVIPILSWSVPFSIALAVAIGNAIVLVTLWMNVFESTAYVKAGSDKQVRRILYPIRMIRTASLILTPFTILLFVPYIFEANWFVNWISSIPGFKGNAESIYTWAFGLSRIDASTRFLISQLVATLGVLIVGGLQLWRVRGTKNLLRALRRRR